MYGAKFAFQTRLGWLVVGRKFTIFALFQGQIPSTSPPGGLYSRGGRFNGGFFALRFWGLIHGGAYFRNSTVRLQVAVFALKTTLSL